MLLHVYTGGSSTACELSCSSLGTFVNEQKKRRARMSLDFWLIVEENGLIGQYCIALNFQGTRISQIKSFFVDLILEVEDPPP